jgi:hypothetical protein
VVQIHGELELAEPAASTRAASGQILDGAAAQPASHLFEHDLARVPGTSCAVHHEQQ